MNKANSQFLFTGTTKVIALSSEEMKQTEGEFWHIAIPLAFGWGVSTAWAPTRPFQAHRPYYMYGWGW